MATSGPPSEITELSDGDVPLEAVLESIDYVDTHAEELERQRQEMDAELIRRGFMNPDDTWKPISTTTLTKTV